MRDGGFARVARCVHAMAPAALAHARPYSRVLAGHRKRDRVQLRVACVQCCLCKQCGCEQSWQHCASHGVRHACVLDDAQPVSIIPCVRARKRGRHGLRRPGQRAGAQRACCFGATWAFGGCVFFLPCGYGPAKIRWSCNGGGGNGRDSALDGSRPSPFFLYF